MPFRHPRFALAVASVLACSPPVPAQVMTYDFEVHPFSQGWYFSGADGWTTAQARSPTHSFQVGGIFGTPFISNPAGQFVAVDFSTMNAPASAAVEFSYGWQPVRTGAGWQANTFVFRSRGFPTGDRADFWGSAYYVDDVTTRPVSRIEAATIQDTNFAHFMPGPLTYAPAADRQARIPNAISRLASGQQLNAVMFGDSTVSDTANSFFEPKVDRRYPGARLNVQPVVASGAGASYWIQNNRIRDQVMASQPNLLMFGGISTLQSDIPLIGEVIRQARQVNSAIEIVLMSQIAGDQNSPYLNPSLAQPFNPVTGTDYRANLYRLAQQQGVQFWDLTTPWANYILNSGRPYDYFLRDTVHMDGYGNMLAGQIVAGYFAPVPEPSALLLALVAGGAAVTFRHRKK